MDEPDAGPRRGHTLRNDLNLAMDEGRWCDAIERLQELAALGAKGGSIRGAALRVLNALLPEQRGRESAADDIESALFLLRFLTSLPQDGISGVTTKGLRRLMVAARRGNMAAFLAATEMANELTDSSTTAAMPAPLMAQVARVANLQSIDAVASLQSTLETKLRADLDLAMKQDRWVEAADALTALLQRNPAPEPHWKRNARRLMVEFFPLEWGPDHPGDLEAGVSLLKTLAAESPTAFVRSITLGLKGLWARAEGGNTAAAVAATALADDLASRLAEGDQLDARLVGLIVQVRLTAGFEPVTETYAPSVSTPLAPRRVVRRTHEADSHAWEELNNRFLDRTVVIIGAGQQLNTLSDHDLALLERVPTIGLNRTFFACPVDVFLTSYAFETALAQRHLGQDRLFVQMEAPSVPAPRRDGVINLTRRILSPWTFLPRFLVPPEPILYTNKNAALAAAHLALITGARRIMFIGVEQTDSRYFYHDRPELQRELKEYYLSLYEQWAEDLFGRHDRDKVLPPLIALIDQNEIGSEQPFHMDHTSSVAGVISMLSWHGVEVWSTIGESVVAKAGAPIVPVTEALSLAVAENGS